VRVGFNRDFVSDGYCLTDFAKHYSIFDSDLYRNLDAEWRFSQENATLHDLKEAICESKML